MRNVKKWLALPLSVIMTLGVVACGNNETSGDNNPENGSTSSTISSVDEKEEEKEEKEEKEPVLLEWYFRGNGQQEDTDEVEARVNELLKEREYTQNRCCCQYSNRHT